jgi:hypothetical protein
MPRLRPFVFALVAAAVIVASSANAVRLHASASSPPAPEAPGYTTAVVHPNALRRYGTVADPLRVVVWGDSVAATFEPVVADALARLRARAGPAVMLGRAALGFGLTDPNPAIVNGRVTTPTFPEWRSKLGRTMGDDRPDDVIVLIGTWDVLHRHIGDAWLEPGNSRWRAWYTALVVDAARRITAHGAHVTWLTHPCVTDPNRNAGLPAVNAVYRDVAARLPRVDLVDLDAMVCPHGRYDPRFRSPDGTHIAADASASLGAPFASALIRAWDLPAR